jgi:hypothetical protein
MNRTDYFSCNRCRMQYRVDSEGPAQSALAYAPRVIRHCPDSEDVPVDGKATRFQERRGGVWVDVQRWIDAAYLGGFKAQEIRKR